MSRGGSRLTRRARLALAAWGGLALLPACIPRSPAPREPAPAPAPYAAVAAMLELQLPTAAGDPLPRAARLAFGAEPGHAFADDALLHGDLALLTFPGQGTPDLSAVLQRRPLVLLVDSRRDVCALASLAPDALLAVRPPGAAVAAQPAPDGAAQPDPDGAAQPEKPTAGAAFPREPLRGVPVAERCPLP